MKSPITLKQFGGYTAVAILLLVGLYGLVSSGINLYMLTRDVAANELNYNVNQEPTSTPIIAEPDEPMITTTPEGSVFIPESDGLIPDKITMPSISLTLPVRYVPLVDGTWEVNDAVANYAEGTSLLNSEAGNVGLFGHDRDNAFHYIKDLKVGDKIELMANGYIFHYTVTDSYDTIPTDVEVYDQTEEPTITLVTCSGVFSEQRYIVKASLDSVELESNE